MKRKRIGAIIAALFGLCMGVSPVSAREETVKKAPLKKPPPFAFFGVPDVVKTAPIRARYQMFRASLPAQTRRAVIERIPAIQQQVAGDNWGQLSSDEIEARIRTVLYTSLGRKVALPQDILTLYALLEMTLPESDYLKGVAARFNPETDWVEGKQKSVSATMLLHIDLQMSGSAGQLLSELMTATSDADPAVIKNLR